MATYDYKTVTINNGSIDAPSETFDYAEYYDEVYDWNGYDERQHLMFVLILGVCVVIFTLLILLISGIIRHWRFIERHHMLYLTTILSLILNWGTILCVVLNLVLRGTAEYVPFLVQLGMWKFTNALTIFRWHTLEDKFSEVILDLVLLTGLPVAAGCICNVITLICMDYMPRLFRTRHLSRCQVVFDLNILVCLAFEPFYWHVSRLMNFDEWGMIVMTVTELGWFMSAATSIAGIVCIMWARPGFCVFRTSRQPRDVTFSLLATGQNEDTIGTTENDADRDT